MTGKTIVGIATTTGIGAISIIRLSGPDAIKIANQVFWGRNLNNVASHTIHYGYIVDNGEKIDEVLVTVMKKPKTYTKEDVVEINCHGGISTTNKVLEVLLTHGCEVAEPGEFTKRAFLNGRIDLLEAEGVMSIINAQTDLNRQLAFNQLKGSVSRKIIAEREKLTRLLANIAVNIDYPEYEDIEEVNYEMIKNITKDVKKKLNQIYKESKQGKIIEEGIKTVIIGKPNVGKSSLLNALIEENKAIVTDVAGTTRDVVEGKLNIGGVLLNLADTAGIRKTVDEIEKIGVEKSMELINQAELVLLVLDNSQRITAEEKKIIEKIKEKNYILVINKVDLVGKIEKSKFPADKIVETSVFDEKTIYNLKTKINEMFRLEKLSQKDLTYLTSARSIALLQKVLKILDEIEAGVKSNKAIDVLEIDIRRAWKELGLITGEVFEDELIDNIFENFCLGK